MRPGRALFAVLAGSSACLLVALVACGGDGPNAGFETEDATTAADGTASLPPHNETDAFVPDAGEDVAFVPPTLACDASPCVTRIVAGQSHYCGVLDDGTVRCWGDPTLLGSGAADGGAIDAAARPGPLAIPGVDAVTEIVASVDRTCVTRTDGGVDCWGAQEPAPTRLTGLGATQRYYPAPSQGDGSRLACTIAPSGAVGCAGDSLMIALPGGPTSLAFDLEGRTALGVSFAPPTDRQYGITTAAFIIDSQGELRSWGWDPQMLGRETPIFLDYTAAPVTGLPPVRSVGVAGDHACAVSTSGHLFCWGIAGNAMLGVGYVRDEALPVEVVFAERWPHQVAASDTHSCAAMTKGSVYCWGGVNASGERGVTAEGVTYIPVKAASTPGDVISVAVGNQSTCALVRNGSVWCWGANYAGQLGRGSRDGERHPVPAPVIFP